MQLKELDVQGHWILVVVGSLTFIGNTLHSAGGRDGMPVYQYLADQPDTAQGPCCCISFVEWAECSRTFSKFLLGSEYLPVQLKLTAGGEPMQREKWNLGAPWVVTGRGILICSRANMETVGCQAEVHLIPFREGIG